ncbi:lytic murein transglycosylase [Meridianimarinicoccus aquatilis]|uniref:Lytic murein transglycosylase n=1 Tax=Meridianimarinicoccus aquatilis TaxID=2552766 RepID=A0A4R6B554_9RHOB|nr:lytic murein transglycosylase [Fluviibacterium aquatile]QIE43711.1 lytic murein transglycosylase [Rhodobacteraceae bacterium SC52]TDL90373.1 lytic murein transglycosylase [Fluviibacterium aquatile]
MTLSRRTFTLSLAACWLTACAGGVTRSSPAVAMQPVDNPAFDAWLAGFRGRARAQGISEATLNTALRNAGYLPGVIERDRNQTEFTRTLEDYLAIAASDERVSNGRAALSQQSSALASIENRYGVDRAVVTAVWGLESSYGTRRGDIPVVSSTATLAFDGRRGAFFEKQLIAALKILQAGDTTPDRMLGSWAGAMGHTQFIPTSYLAFAVDHTGDGRRDIWDNDPSDALASTAAYLKRSGWQSGQPWGVEVRLPSGFSGPFGRGSTRSPAQWAAAGVRDMDGKTVPNYGAASILIPSGATGPAFMVFRNFTVITRYNNSESYVIGIGHLSDRIKGGPAIRGRFPPDAQGFYIEDRRALQSGLTAAGFDTGGTDGVIGPNTKAAISGYQQANGLPVTGIHTRDLLARLGR